MKKIVFLILLSAFFLNMNAQIITPVKWNYEILKLSSSSYELKAVAIIDKPWHLYGQYFEDGGPIKLKFNFEENSNYELSGMTTEDPKPKTVRDDIFNIDVNYFADRAVFTQKIKLKGPTEIKLIIEGQACNDNTGMCVMITGEHIYKLK